MQFRQQSSKSAPLKVSGKENVDIKRNQSKDEKSHEGEKRKIRRPIEGVAQKKLVLKPVKKKPVVKEVVKPMVKPLPFITKTNLYDEHWMMKQERGKELHMYMYIYLLNESTEKLNYMYISKASLKV